MNILISPNALTGTSDDLLWEGALYGLKRLQQLGHAIHFDLEQLSQKQQQLLKNDQVSPNMFEDDSVDLKVQANGDRLNASAEVKTQIETRNWIVLSQKICFPERTTSISRKTAETDITVELNLDGTGQSAIDTGLKFFDHMLEQIAKHGLIDLTLDCDGDLEVDEHHTIEDVAITLGEAILDALGDKIGINRYSFVLPMDESQATVALDFSGRPFLKFEGHFDRSMVGDVPTEMIEHFFYSLAINMKTTLHISVEGQNDHHKIEACFKGLARCLRSSVSRSERNLNILPSTKEAL